MSGADCRRFAEALDDVEEVLNAQEVIQLQMVAEGMQKVLQDSRISD